MELTLLTGGDLQGHRKSSGMLCVTLDGMNPWVSTHAPVLQTEHSSIYVSEYMSAIPQNKI